MSLQAKQYFDCIFDLDVYIFFSLDINKIWTGLHEEGGYLVWDEISPHKVRAYNEYVFLKRISFDFPHLLSTPSA